jgi:hypothetical protein
MTDNRPDDYRTRITTAIFQALVNESITVASDGSRTAVLLSNEIVEALTDTVAIVWATSVHTSSPTKLRECCDRLAKTLYRRTLMTHQSDGIGKLFENRFAIDPERVS